VVHWYFVSELMKLAGVTVDAESAAIQIAVLPTRTFGWGLVALVTLVTVVACGGGHKSNPAIATTSTEINQTAGWSPDAISTVKTSC
jgi:hypothetical protein